VRVAVLTTSYPRWEGDAAGRFVADAVARLRAHVDVEVVSAQTFRHYGIAYGHGVLGNLKRRPWLGALVPLMLAGFVHAARDAAREADLLHGIDLPAEPGTESEPPHVLYAGRLSREKGVLELVRAAQGLPLVVLGDGPLRKRVPQARGFVPRGELETEYARAAVVACPSRREGFGVACLEAMAYGKPVVASAVGGLRDLVVEGETGLLVPPRDPDALRAALERLLGDRDLRLHLGAAARERARERFSWERVVDATLQAYADASGRMLA
jgi:glycosyltransferase involved in cell wall biosynthesis